MTTSTTQDPQADQISSTQDLPPDQSAQTPGPVPYERFKTVNTELTTLKQELTALKQEQGQKQQAETDLATRLATIEADLATERATNLRLSVAAAKGLPAELVDRLRGETKESLEQDADSLLALVRKTGPGVPPPGGPSAKPNIATMTPAQIRDARAKGQI